MTFTAVGIGPIKQAIVRALRDIDDLKSAVGSDGIDEGIAHSNASYPRVIFDVASSRNSRQFGTEAVVITTVDIWCVSDDVVEANNLDQLVFTGMEDVSLDFSGIASIAGNEPSTLLCQRLRSLSLVDEDRTGNKVYQVGGSYQIWTDRL